MDTAQRAASLARPLARPTLRAAWLASLLIAGLVALVSLAGLVWQEQFYPTRAALLAFLPTDGFMLVVGVPVLLAVLILAYRGRIIGLLGWPGMLFVVLYIYLPYVIAAPLSPLFVLYLLLVALSTTTLVGLVAKIDGTAIRPRLNPVPLRASGGILMGLALLIIVRQGAVIAGVLAAATPVDLIERATWIADFTIAVPVLLFGGWQLWRRTMPGYVTGAGILLGYGLLALSVIPFFMAEARLDATPIDGIGIMVMLVMAALCFGPLVLLLRKPER